MFDNLIAELQVEVLRWCGLAELFAVQCCSQRCRVAISAAELREWFQPNVRELLRRFTAACRAGDLSRAEWLTCTFGAAPDELPRLFTAACTGGHLAMAQWLQSRWGARTGVTVRTLVQLCHAGHLDVLRWLVARNTTIHPPEWWCPVHQEMFSAACAAGRHEVARWLVANCTPSADADHWRASAALAESCLNGHLGIAKWIVSHFRISQVSLRAELEADGVLDRAEISGHAAVVAWLR